MKIYVDEMPKSCAECDRFCLDEKGRFRCILNSMPDYRSQEEKETARRNDCPLNSIQTLFTEKEKEIEKLKIILNMQAVQVSEEQRLSLINTNCIQYNQNQIAIEQLEKLLEKTQTLNLMVKSGHYVNEKRADVVFKDVIEQQINELKGDVNEK